MMSRRRFAIGVICACAGALFWGLSGTCAQYLFAEHSIHVANIIVVRNILAAALFVFAILAFKRGQLKEMVIRKRNWVVILGYGLTLFLTQVLYMSAIEIMNAGTVTVLQMIYMIYILVITSVRNRALPSWQSLLGFLLALTATVLIATQGDLSSINVPLEGLAIILVEAACVAGYILIPKRLIADYGSLPSVGAAMVIDAVLSIIYWLVTSSSEKVELMTLNLQGALVLLIGIGVLGTFASFLMYMYGVGVVGPVTGGLLGAIEPIGAMGASAIWLGTAFTGYDWVGMLLMLGMLACVTIPSKDSKVADSS